MRVAIVGTFDATYSRNRTIADILALANVEVETIAEPLWGAQRHLLVNAPKWRLATRATVVYPRLIWRMISRRKPDAYIVLYPGHVDMLLVGLVARLRRVPVLFDVFISLHETIVDDRALRGPESRAARLALLLDKLACKSASLVLADTPQDAEFFAALTGVPLSRFRVLWVGAQAMFHPVPAIEPEPAHVFFHGTYIRLHGVETIVLAAKELEAAGIRFTLLGDGQEREDAETLAHNLQLRNVEFKDAVPPEELVEAIASATICLGVFGTTAKASRVVPNKLFEYTAVGRPVVTADTPAIRGAFGDEVIRVPAGDPIALAAAIRELMSDPERRTSIAAAGHARYDRDYSHRALAQLIRAQLDELVGRRATAMSDGPRPGNAS